MTEVLHKAVVLEFDHGTILCRGLPVGFEPPPGSNLIFDFRVGAFRAKACDYSGELNALAGPQATDGLDGHDGLDGLDGLDGPRLSIEDRVQRPLPVAPFSRVSLRTYQDAAVTAWQIGSGRGSIVLPTGAGKTRVAIAAIAQCGVPTLVLVPTRVLLRQWRDALCEFYRGGGARGSVGALGDGEHSLRGLTVATLETGRRMMARIGNRFGLLVVDEMHHLAGGAFDDTVEMCTAPRRLGLTATPPSGLASLRLAELIGPVRFELRIADLMGRYLAELAVFRLNLALAADERRDYEQARSAFLPAWERFLSFASGRPFTEFVRTCRQTDEGREALRAWHRARRIASFTSSKREALGKLLPRLGGRKVLIFTHDKESAYAIASEFLVMPITSDISRREREWALDAFRDGRLRTLVSSRVLNEGVDVPDADVAIVVGSSQGTREYVQRIGRVLRPAEGKRAMVFELISADTTEMGQAFRRRDAFRAT